MSTNSRRFNLFHCIGYLNDSIENIVNNDQDIIDATGNKTPIKDNIHNRDGKLTSQLFYSGNSVNLPPYPYISYTMTNPHHPEQWGPTREWEIYKTELMYNFYSDIYHGGPKFPIIACDDLHRMLRDPYYTEMFHENGIVIADATSNGSTNNDISNANDIYQQSMKIVLRFSVIYKSNVDRIHHLNFEGRNV